MVKTRATDFEGRYRLVREVVETIALTVLLFLVIRLAVQNFNIDGMSMEPNLHDQELVLVDKWSYLFHTPARGDIIVFQAPPHPDQDYVKRIIGLPGDVITIDGTTVVVNGTPLKESYIDPERQGDPYAPFVNRLVPPNSYFVLGDNRAGSSDSRDWGCVPRKNIVGKASFVYWPFGADNYGLLPNVSSTYADVHAPSSALVSAAAATDVCPIMNGQNSSQPAANAAPDGKSHIERPGAEGMLVPVLLLPGLLVPFSAALSYRQRRKRGWKRGRNIGGDHAWNRRGYGDRQAGAAPRALHR